MPKPLPERTCLATRETLPKEALLRFVVGPGDQLVYDHKGSLPGRGLWVKPSAELLRMAIAKNQFSRSAKQQVKIGADIVDIVSDQLEQQVYRYLERAVLAKELVAGFEKLSRRLQEGKIAILVHSLDAAEDGRKKLDKWTDGVRIIRFGEPEKLQAAIKRPNPVHLGLKNGGIALAIGHAYDRWAGFSGVNEV